MKTRYFILIMKDFPGKNMKEVGKIFCLAEGCVFFRRLKQNKKRRCYVIECLFVDFSFSDYFGVME